MVMSFSNRVYGNGADRVMNNLQWWPCVKIVLSGEEGFLSGGFFLGFLCMGFACMVFVCGFRDGFSCGFL